GPPAGQSAAAASPATAAAGSAPPIPAGITISAAVAIPALLAPAAHPGIAISTGHTGPAGTDAVFSVAFSPDGKTLASAGRDRTVRLWNVATPRQIGSPLTGHTD